MFQVEFRIIIIAIMMMHNTLPNNTIITSTKSLLKSKSTLHKYKITVIHTKGVGLNKIKTKFISVFESCCIN